MRKQAGNYGPMYDPGYTEDPDEHKEPCRDNRCTPEKLEALMRLTWNAHRRMPTLAEIKQEFGGLLGAFCDYWTLEKRGVIKNGKLVEES